MPTDKNTVTLKMFSAGWCQPCKQVKPEVEKVAKEMGLTLEVLDADKDFEEFNKYSIVGVPVVVILNDGEESARMNYVGEIMNIKKYLKDFA